MKTLQQIEEMADISYMSEYYDPNDLSMSNSSYNAGYIEGATQMQKDLLESASEGFREWIYKYPDKCDLRDFKNPNHNYFVAEEAWQACALSYEKKLKEEREAFSFTSESRVKEIQEKDEEIERLKQFPLNGIVCECMTDCDCISEMKDKYQEAVKDIYFLMSHASTEWIGSWKLEEIKTKYGLDKKEE